MADVVGTLRVVLEADASDLNEALKEATTDVKELAAKLQKDLEPRQRAVNAAVRDFLGGNEIRKAQEYALAIDKIGDISKLTAQDQLKVNKAVSAALSHYKALGVQAPKNLMDIERATRSAATSMSSIGPALKGAAAALGVTFSVGAVVSFGKSVFDAASSIDDMSKRLGVSAEFAQRFKFGLEQTGSSLEAGERALFNMNKVLAEAAQNSRKLEELNKTLRGTGVSAQDLIKMRPQEAFVALTKAAGGTANQLQQTAIMQEFFARGAIELMPLVIEGYDKVTASVAVMSDTTVDRLAAAQDKWDEFFNFLTIHSGEAVGQVMEDAAGLVFLPQFLGDLAEAVKVAGIHPVALRRVLEQQRALRQAEANLRGTGLNANAGKDVSLTGRAKPSARTPSTSGNAARVAPFFTSEKLAAEVRVIVENLKRVGGESQLTAQDLADLAEKIISVEQRGGKLDQELQAIRDKFMFFRDMVKATRIEFKLLNKTPAFAQFMGGADRSSRMGAFQNMPLLPGVDGMTPAAMRGKPLNPLNDWQEGLADLIDGFEDLASIAGQSFSRVTRGIGSGLSATKLFADGWSQMGSAKTFSGVLSGLGSVAGAIGQGIQLAIELGKALHDAFTRSESEKAAADIRRNFGVDITEDSKVAKDIERMVEETGIDRNLAIELHLPQIIQEGGGITASNFENFRDRANELFDDIALGGREGQLALEALDGTLAELGRHVTEQGGVWDRDFVAMLQRAQAEGRELASVMELVSAELTRGASGLNAAVAGGAAAGSQGEFDRLSRVTLATFNAFIANGRSAAEAVAAIAPSIDALRQSATDLGFAGNDAFNQLVRWRDLVSVNQPLLDQIGGLNELMVALANVGALTQDTFTDLQVQGLDAFTSLTEAGFSQQEALQQIAPMLESIIEAHNERGLAIGEETQALIDQAQESGVIAEEQINYQEVQLDLIAALVDAVGGDLPESFRKLKAAGQDAAEGIQDAFSDIDIDIPVNFDMDDMPRLEAGDLPGFARGGIVNAGRGSLAVLHGKEAIVPLEGPDAPDWASLISDYSTGPSLPSLSASSALGGVAEAGGPSMAPSAGTVIFEMDGRTVARGTVPYLPDEVRRFHVGVK